MALREIRVVLSVADPMGKHPDPDEVASTLTTDVFPYQVYGRGTTGSAVGIEILSLSCAGFVRESEPWGAETDWEAFERAIDDSLVNFASWLSRISTSAVAALRSRGLDVYVLVNMEIDCDQLDFYLPHELSSELGRLRLRLCLLSNE